MVEGGLWCLFVIVLRGERVLVCRVVERIWRVRVWVRRTCYLVLRCLRLLFVSGLTGMWVCNWTWLKNALSDVCCDEQLAVAYLGMASEDYGRRAAPKKLRQRRRSSFGLARETRFILSIGLFR